MTTLQSRRSRFLSLLPVLVLLVICLSSMASGSSSKVKIFLVPHSHDDVGWLETIDGYYETYIKDIYTTVTEMVSQNRARRFNVVEVAYIDKWLSDPDTTTLHKQVFTQMVQNGTIEVVLGGWVMHDEAVTTFEVLYSTHG
eukprot:TRINITY_DN17617_c0_g1_i1.p1 TRINITY_DN17617_c0_g1~~TRINITY_DN17617_c0_g1_i1.p1  ORF type:complete len:159 (+),score=14.43 TRINITY_DN17617_c0_g1_i1:56-478(+)